MTVRATDKKNPGTIGKSHSWSPRLKDVSRTDVSTISRVRIAIRDFASSSDAVRFSSATSWPVPLRRPDVGSLEIELGSLRTRRLPSARRSLPLSRLAYQSDPCPIASSGLPRVLLLIFVDTRNSYFVLRSCSPSD